MGTYPAWRLVVRFRAPRRAVERLRSWIERSWPELEGRLDLIDSGITITAGPEIFDDPTEEG